MRKSLLFIVLAFAGLGITLITLSCRKVKVPAGIVVVQDLDIEKYMGRWYEIARFDFKYEKDMNQVTADYAIKNDKTIDVSNRGYNYVEEEWQEKEGKAKFLEGPTSGALKVSFFGPFYSGYNIVSIDEDYQYALVFGESTDYIWMLSRSKTMSEEIKEKYLQMARDQGYDLNRLVWTQQ